MSDLQLALLAAGVAAVGAVLAYNKWQEMQYRRQAEATFRAEREDVLLRNAIATPSVAAAERIEPVLEPEPARGPAHPALSEQLDYIVMVEASEGVAGD